MSRRASAIVPALAALVLVACAEPSSTHTRDPHDSWEGAPLAPALAAPRTPGPGALAVAHPMRLVRRLPLVGATFGLRSSDGSVASRRAATMVVDTGAGTPLVVDLALARELRLPVRGRTRIVSQGGLVEAQVVEVASLRLGDFELGPTEGIACDLSAFRALFGGDYGGILGFPLFDRWQLVLDYPLRTLELRACGGQYADERDVVEYQLLDRTPVAPFQVGNWEIPLTIDSGLSFALLLPERFSEQLRWRTPFARGPQSLGVTGFAAHATAVLDGPFAVGAHRVEDPTVILGKGLIGLVGGEVLERYRVCFDPERRTVGFFEPAGSRD